MGRLIDLTGRTFGRLTVLKRDTPKGHHNLGWLCRCSCKKQATFMVRGADLRRGNVRSCGCLRSEKSKERFARMHLLARAAAEKRKRLEAAEGAEDAPLRPDEPPKTWANAKRGLDSLTAQMGV